MHDDDEQERLAHLAWSKYQPRFEAAFDDGVTIPNIVRALAQFQRTLVSPRLVAFLVPCARVRLLPSAGNKRNVT